MTRNETNGPMSPAQATKLINEISKSEIFGLALTNHAEQQMDRRNLIMDDVLHVLKHGFVYADGESTTRRNSYK